MRPARPRDVATMLDEIAELAARLGGEVEETFEVLYSRVPGPRSEKVKASGSPDPTADLAVHGEALKHHYARACRAVHAARVELVRAVTAFERVVAAADAREDFREGRYEKPLQPALVTHAELAEARAAQAKRKAAFQRTRVIL